MIQICPYKNIKFRKKNEVFFTIFFKLGEIWVQCELDVSLIHDVRCKIVGF